MVRGAGVYWVGKCTHYYIYRTDSTTLGVTTSRSGVKVSSLISLAAAVTRLSREFCTVG